MEVRETMQDPRKDGSRSPPVFARDAEVKFCERTLAVENRD